MFEGRPKVRLHEFSSEMTGRGFSSVASSNGGLGFEALASGGGRFCCWLLLLLGGDLLILRRVHAFRLTCTQKLFFFNRII